ncbi:helix-turn-helix transcriptional regulator [Yoonia sp. SS1-5]|uniref:Helix-turn-helix domain-containing protein n=1 Tax=Yoonia rhodophyticola TaxID=3137370 RepID=A0AAN0NJN4_9RHOB
MAEDIPAAYCFFQDIAPRPPLDAVFDRDYLLYAAKGAMRLTVGPQSWLLPPSFAAWMPANTRFRVEIAKPVTSCSVLTRPSFCTNMPPEPAVFQMSVLARHMIRHCRDWGKGSPQPPEAEGFFLSLLNVCAVLVSRSVDVARPTATDPGLARAITISEARLNERLTAADIAQAANMSERTMQRRFADHLGMTWSEVLTRQRMIRAIELLSDDTLSVIETAGESGFASLSAFNRAFRVFARTTPSAFRRNLRK